jgi:hypothetical protein
MKYLHNVPIRKWKLCAVICFGLALAIQIALAECSQRDTHDVGPLLVCYDVPTCSRVSSESGGSCKIVSALVSITCYNNGTGLEEVRCFNEYEDTFYLCLSPLGGGVDFVTCPPGP